MQLAELEYFLSGLYPGVVLAIEGKLPFRGLEERLHDGIVVGAALAGKRLGEPVILEFPAKPAQGALAAPIRVNHESFFRISPFATLSRASITRFSLLRGAHAIRLSCTRTGQDGWPGRAALLSWGCRRCRRATRCSSFGRRVPCSRHCPPLSEAFPPLLTPSARMPS